MGTLSASGKSIYQISKEIEVGSYLCSELHLIKKQYKKAYLATIGNTKRQCTLKQSETATTEMSLSISWNRKKHLWLPQFVQNG